MKNVGIIRFSDTDTIFNIKKNSAVSKELYVKEESDYEDAYLLTENEGLKAYEGWLLEDVDFEPLMATLLPLVEGLLKQSVNVIMLAEMNEATIKIDVLANGYHELEWNIATGEVVQVNDKPIVELKELFKEIEESIDTLYDLPTVASEGLREAILN